MSAADYALEPVHALDADVVDALRRIYEDGFPGRLRADFGTLADRPEAGESALALVCRRQPCGFAMLRRLGGTGWTFLRYFVVDQGLRGQGLSGIMWDLLTARLAADGSTLLVFDVEDPAETGCGASESQVRSRRIAFYESHGAQLLPVRGYQAPHGNSGGEHWTPMLLLAAPVAAEALALGTREAPAIVSAVYQYRWGLAPGDPRIQATQVVVADSAARTQE